MNSSVLAVIQSGVSPVCATCQKFWEGRSRGGPCIPPDQRCGGPIAGLDFPLYDGPITNFECGCFACPSPSDMAIKNEGCSRMIGVCKKHLGLLDRLEAVNQGTRITEVRTGKGVLVPVDGWFSAKRLHEYLFEDETGVKLKGGA